MGAVVAAATDTPWWLLPGQVVQALLVRASPGVRVWCKTMLHPQAAGVARVRQGRMHQDFTVVLAEQELCPASQALRRTMPVAEEVVILPDMAQAMGEWVVAEREAPPIQAPARLWGGPQTHR